MAGRPAAVIEHVNHMMTNTRRIVGTRMRQLRKTAGFSQDRLGRASDLSGKFIGEVERGEKSISLASGGASARTSQAERADEPS